MAPRVPVPASRKCSRCKNTKTVDQFSKDPSKASGYRSHCRDCIADAQAARDTRNTAKHDAEDARLVADAEARARRLASDVEPLRASDLDDEFDVGVANDPRPVARRTTARAAKEKRQEFTAQMGAFSDELRSGAASAAKRGDGDVLPGMSSTSGDYIGKLAEQERRFGNRRLARSISLAAAHEALSIRAFREAAAELRGNVRPTGYARAASSGRKKRSVCLLLSDLHLGSDLSSLDEPMPFRAVEEARRLEYVLRQALDYKPQYRKDSELVLLLNGDLIEGQLMHDFRSGAPLTEQKVIFWRYMREFVALCAQQYPSVRVFCQPGNHGRDKVRHPGRATARKWDGHEWEMYYALQQMCSDLRNVEWTLDFRAVTVVDLHGSNLGLTHGDTEVKLGHPDAASAKNAAELDRINATRVHGVEFDAWAFGHFHTPRYHPRKPRVIYNGALVPPNGYARAAGYIGEDCGQFLWEAVAGFPVGDLRFIGVGPAQDRDEKLGTLIHPFRFTE